MDKIQKQSIFGLLQYEIQTLEIKDNNCVKKIGRDTSSHFQISNSEISLNHCQILIIDNIHYIVDLNSTNGTKVNTTILKPFEIHQLNKENDIYLGSLVLKYYIIETTKSEDEKDDDFYIPETQWDNDIIPNSQINTIISDNEIIEETFNIEDFDSDFSCDNDIKIIENVKNKRDNRKNDSLDDGIEQSDLKEIFKDVLDSEINVLEIKVNGNLETKASDNFKKEQDKSNNDLVDFNNRTNKLERQNNIVIAFNTEIHDLKEAQNNDEKFEHNIIISCDKDINNFEINRKSSFGETDKNNRNVIVAETEFDNFEMNDREKFETDLEKNSFDVTNKNRNINVIAFNTEFDNFKMNDKQNFETVLETQDISFKNQEAGLKEIENNKNYVNQKVTRTHQDGKSNQNSEDNSIQTNENELLPKIVEHNINSPNKHFQLYDKYGDLKTIEIDLQKSGNIQSINNNEKSSSSLERIPNKTNDHNLSSSCQIENKKQIIENFSSFNSSSKSFDEKNMFFNHQDKTNDLKEVKLSLNNSNENTKRSSSKTEFNTCQKELTQKINSIETKIEDSFSKKLLFLQNLNKTSDEEVIQETKEKLDDNNLIIKISFNDLELNKKDQIVSDNNNDIKIQKKSIKIENDDFYLAETQFEMTDKEINFVTSHVETSKKENNSLECNKTTNESLQINQNTNENLGNIKKTNESLQINQNTNENVGNNKKTNESLEINKKTNESLEIKKTIESIETNIKTNESLETNQKSNENLETNKKTNESLEINKKTNESLKTNEKINETSYFTETQLLDIDDIYFTETQLGVENQAFKNHEFVKPSIPKENNVICHNNSDVCNINDSIYFAETQLEVPEKNLNCAIQFAKPKPYFYESKYKNIHFTETELDLNIDEKHDVDIYFAETQLEINGDHKTSKEILTKSKVDKNKIDENIHFAETEIDINFKEKNNDDDIYFAETQLEINEDRYKEMEINKPKRSSFKNKIDENDSYFIDTEVDRKNIHFDETQLIETEKEISFAIPKSVVRQNKIKKSIQFVDKNELDLKVDEKHNDDDIHFAETQLEINENFIKPTKDASKKIKLDLNDDDDIYFAETQLEIVNDEKNENICFINVQNKIENEIAIKDEINLNFIQKDDSKVGDKDFVDGAKLNLNDMNIAQSNRENLNSTDNVLDDNFPADKSGTSTNINESKENKTKNRNLGKEHKMNHKNKTDVTFNQNLRIVNYEATSSSSKNESYNDSLDNVNNTSISSTNLNVHRYNTRSKNGISTQKRYIDVDEVNTKRKKRDGKKRE